MTLKATVLLLVLCSLPTPSSSYKIAIFSPHISNSQFLWSTRVAEVLARHNHSVVVYNLEMFETDYASLDADYNVRLEHVNCSRGMAIQSMLAAMAPLTFEDVQLWDPRFKGRLVAFDEVRDSCELLVNNASFLERVRAEKFDIAFAHMYSYCVIGVIHQAGIPTWAYLNSAVILEHIASSIGLPTPPSYSPPLQMDAGEQLDFVERVKSFVGRWLMIAFAEKRIGAAETAFFRRRFGTDFPDLVELSATAALVFVNSNELYDFARPTLHKIVNIGGVGITSGDAKPLTGDFQKLVNASTCGHIVFTLGSMAPAYRMPQEWKDALLRAFAAFPDVQFFMRYEKNDLNERLPANVNIEKWLPQNDLLQHDKCIGLMTHGGYNSLQDAIHAGVPVLTIPLFGDQPRNGHLAAHLGFGIYMRKAEMAKPARVAEAVGAMIHDDSLRSSARRLRAMIARKPVSSEELLVRWTEFAAEFKSLDVLVPYGVHLSPLVYHSVDVVVFLLSLALILLAILFLIFRRILRCISSREKLVSEKKKSQ